MNPHICEHPRKDMEDQPIIPLAWRETQLDAMKDQSKQLLDLMRKRRTADISHADVPKELIEQAILCGGTAQAGLISSHGPLLRFRLKLKQKIREAAETEERKTYQERMPDAWREVLQPLGTDAIKEHLTDAPWVVVLFRQSKRLRPNGEWGPTYYSSESCGIAAGMFIHAIHNMGLVTLTHTPSPMGFLRDILNRPDHEHAMLVLPVGYPAEDAMVPDLQRKTLDEIAVFFEE